MRKPAVAAVAAASKRGFAAAMALLVIAFALTGCRNQPARRLLGGSASTTASTDPPSTAEPTSAATTVPPTSTTGPVASGCGKAVAAGTTTISVTSGGLARTAILYVPASYLATKPTPLVIDLHGYGSSAQVQLAYGDFRPEAERDGFVVVAPQGQGKIPHFDLFGVAAGDADDVVFVGDLLDRLAGDLCLDAKRIFSAGMSNGSALTITLACRLSDRIAAFGAVSAEFFAPACAAARSVPLMAFHGTKDPVVPFEGGQVTCCGNATVPPAPQAMAEWAGHDGCSATPVILKLSPMVERRTWSGCRGGAEVILHVIEGGGHTWPGTALDGGKDSRLGPTTHEIDASAVLWDFFAHHPLT